jgi:hypothetical protein
MNSRLYWTFAITSLALFAFTLDRLVGLVFAGHGGYASRADFTAGFVPAMWLAAGLAAAGVLAAVSLPRGAGRRRTRGLTDPLARCDNDARDAVSAGAAG